MLSQKSRHALHALLFLARRGSSATTAEIAEAENIPRKFLEHILSLLRARGLVVGKRGPTGGYVLAREASRISFAEVLRAIDGPLALAPCASQTAFRPCPDCKSIETCEIRPVLIAVRDATAARLEGMSLAQAISGQQPDFPG
jgi:Rrf2 family protein